MNKKTNARRRLADRVKPRTQWSSQKPDHNKSGDTFIIVAIVEDHFTGRNLTFVESTFIGKLWSLTNVLVYTRRKQVHVTMFNYHIQ